jgi:hypothetical protein
MSQLKIFCMSKIVLNKMSISAILQKIYFDFQKYHGYLLKYHIEIPSFKNQVAFKMRVNI